MNKHYCKDCGKEISRNPLAKRCHQCNGKEHSKFMTGKKNPMHGKKGKLCPNWTGVIYYCIDCGTTVSHYNVKRCRKCYNIWMKNNPIFKTLTGKKSPHFGKVRHSKYIKYNNICMHSSWELAYAKYLDKQEIKWLYEPKTFDLGNTTYTPDFYLLKSKTYIEVKGYWRKDALNKFLAFRLLYPEIKIKILNRNGLFLLKIINKRGIVIR
jgi:DNA-directed RNA polymerase subunit RPC12/RpoP